MNEPESGGTAHIREKKTYEPNESKRKKTERNMCACVILEDFEHLEEREKDRKRETKACSSVLFISACRINIIIDIDTQKEISSHTENVVCTFSF